MANQNALSAAGQDTSKNLTIDMSASWRSPAFDLNANGGVSSLSVDASWPNTGTPVGAFTIEVSNDMAASSGTAISVTAQASFVAQQPGGASDTGAFFLDNVQCSAARAWLVYTRTSGGTGCVGDADVNFKAKV